MPTSDTPRRSRAPLQVQTDVPSEPKVKRGQNKRPKVPKSGPRSKGKRVAHGEGQAAFSPRVDPATDPITREKQFNLREDLDEILPPRVDRIDVPEQPFVKEDGPERDEQQVVRIEKLMIKGFTDTGHLAELLGIADRRKVERYKRRVYARWEQDGGASNMAQHRGRALSRLDELRQNYWVLIQNSADERVKVVALNSLMTLEGHELKLRGITEKTIEKLNQMTNDNPAVMRMAQQGNLAEAARRLAAILAQNRASAGVLDKPNAELLGDDEIDPFERAMAEGED